MNNSRCDDYLAADSFYCCSARLSSICLTSELAEVAICSKSWPASPNKAVWAASPWVWSWAFNALACCKTFPNEFWYCATLAGSLSPRRPAAVSESCFAMAAVWSLKVAFWAVICSLILSATPNKQTSIDFLGYSWWTHLWLGLHKSEPEFAR